MTPELSASLLPPKRWTFCPLMTVSGRPSKMSYLGEEPLPVASTPLFSEELPNSTTPPHRPRS